jgi:hypothetical protein
MTAENKKSTVVPSRPETIEKIKRLESELKTAFKEAKFDVVRKKAEEMDKVDVGNRVATRILEKANQEEAEMIKRANRLKIQALESKLDQEFRIGNLPAVEQAIVEIKKVDPANLKAKKVEESIATAKAALEQELKKEKIRKLSTEIQFFVNSADWNGATAKANELLAMDWGNPVAMNALKKAATSEHVDVKTLVKVAQPKQEQKPGFLAKILGKGKGTIPAPAKAVPEKKVVKEATKVSSPVVLKPELPKAIAAISKEPPALPKAQLIPAKAQGTSALAAKPEVQPKAVPKSATLAAPKVQAVKKESALKSFFSKMFAKKEKAAPKAVPAQAKAVAQVKRAEPAPVAPVAKPVAAPMPSVVKPVVSMVPKVEAKPTTPSVSTPKKEAPHESIFGKWFQKKAEAKPAIAVSAPKTPAAPVVPLVAPKVEAKPAMASAPIQKMAEPQLKVEQKAVAKSEGKAAEKGNIFTSLFGKQEAAPSEPQKSTRSVLETIVAKTAPSKPAEKKEKKFEESKGEMYLKFSNAFLQFSVVFIAVSAVFFYVENMDTDNRVLAMVGRENNAIQLHKAADDVAAKQGDINTLNKEVEKYKGGYSDDRKAVIDQIIQNRMDWPTILDRLNEVTDSVYEQNSLSQYVQYNNYSYNADTGELSVSGTLSDPLGKNLTKLAELEQAFQYFPRDPSNPNDDRKPYFYGLQGFNSYSKSLNTDTGRYVSNFSLKLSTKQQ